MARKKGMDQTEVPHVTVASSRLQSVIEALSYASVDEFDSCLALLQLSNEKDEFSELETAFSIFVRELGEAKSELNRALTQQEAANRELEAKLETIEMQQAAERNLERQIKAIEGGKYGAFKHTTFEQYEARYFSVVCEFMQGDMPRATKDSRFTSSTLK